MNDSLETTDGGKFKLRKDESNGSFALSSLFHNTPKKMPATHSIFKVRQALQSRKRPKIWALFTFRRQIQGRRVAALHGLVEGWHIGRHNLLPRRQLLVQLASQ